MQLVDNKMFLEMSFYPKHEFLSVKHLPTTPLTMFEIPVSSNRYKFEAKLKMRDTKKQMITKNVSICLENSKNLHFQATKSIVQLLKQKLCREQYECDGEEDLKVFNDKAIALYLEMDGLVKGGAEEGNCYSWIDF